MEIKDYNKTMTIKELREKLARVEDESAEVFCAQIISLESAETEKTILTVDLTKAFSIEDAILTSKLKGEAGKQNSILLGIYPVPKNLLENETDILEIESEQ